MTLYTELRQAGYFQDGLSDDEKKKIADKVEGARNQELKKSEPKGAKKP